MTECNTYTGDLLLIINDDGDWDINYINGQPCMTDGFDTAVIMSCFVEPDSWQNGTTNNPAERYESEFPEVVKNGRVDDDTLRAGIAAAKKAMKWMTDIAAADKIEVTGGVLNIYGLYWQIDIIKGNINTRYSINWDKGVVALIKAA